MLFDRLRALRKTRTMKVLIGGSAVGLALSGVAAAQQGIFDGDDEEEREGEDVTLDLEGGAVSVSTEDLDPLTPGEAGGLSETAESPVSAEEEASPVEEETPPTPATVDSPVSPESVPSPESPPSPASPESPPSPASPESPPSPASPPEADDD